MVEMDESGEEKPFRMQCWVVSGPAGAGKSLLTDYLVARGAGRIDGDAVGHDLLRQPEVAVEIVQEFGPGVLVDGQVDRPRLGRIVFDDLPALERLNAIMLPRLAVRFQGRFAHLAATEKYRLAVLEAAVYFLLPSLEPVDLTIAVVAGAALREERLVGDGRLTRKEARRRIAAQKDWDGFWPHADVVLVNDGSRSELERAAARLLTQHLGGCQ